MMYTFNGSDVILSIYCGRETSKTYVCLKTAVRGDKKNRLWQ